MNHMSTGLWGMGLYTVPEAARLLAVPSQRIRRWLGGGGVLQGDLDTLDGAPGLSFGDLMDIRFIDAFRRYGLSLQRIRRASERACALLETEHPFQTKAFRTDGRTVFAELAKDDGAKLLLDLSKSQYAFERVISPSLYAGFEYDDHLTVRRWRPMPGHTVLLDPKRSFGQPIVDHGVPTAVLAEAVAVEGSVRAVGQWYEVPEREVRDAVAFEERLAA